VAGRGDAVGDGWPELLLGARGFADSMSSGGAAFLLFANGADGPTRATRQRRADDAAPIALLGVSDSPASFRLAALGRSAAGRVDVALEWEAKPLGAPFDGASTRGAWVDPGAPLPGAGSRAELAADVAGLASGEPWRWRARVRAASPLFPTSVWVSPAGNGSGETDLRTAPPASAVAERPARRSALEVFPSPFRKSLAIRFTVDRPGHVRLVVHDVAGRRVATLVDGRLAPGTRRIDWDGRNADGRPVAPGCYFLRLGREDGVESDRVVRR
jgi:hypothetical protein